MRFFFVFMTLLTSFAWAKSSKPQKRSPASAGVVQLPFEFPDLFVGCEATLTDFDSQNLGPIKVELKPRTPQSKARMTFADSEGQILDTLELCSKSCAQGARYETISITAVEHEASASPDPLCISPSSADYREISIAVGKSASLRNRARLKEALIGLQYTPTRFKCTWRQGSNGCK